MDFITGEVELFRVWKLRKKNGTMPRIFTSRFLGSSILNCKYHSSIYIYLQVTFLFFPARISYEILIYRILPKHVIIQTRGHVISLYFIIWGFAATSPLKPLHKFDILFRISWISGVLILPAKLMARRIIRILAIFAVP